MSGLKELNAIETTWYTLYRIGQATENALILENTSKVPMEILRVPATANLVASSVQVYSTGKSSGHIIVDWSDIGPVSLPIVAATDIPFSYGQIGSNSLITNTSSTATRIVLLPGDSLREVAAVFTISSAISLIYRYMPEQEFS